LRFSFKRKNSSSSTKFLFGMGSWHGDAGVGTREVRIGSIDGMEDV
jgi:hypothetical protein